MFLNKLIRSSTVSKQLYNQSIKSWAPFTFIHFQSISVSKNLKSYSTGSAIRCSNKYHHADLRKESIILQKNIFPAKVLSQNISFFKQKTAYELWKGVTGVSSSGRRRGRAAVGRKARSTNLNKGQRIGEGENRMLWPGLNSPVYRAKEIVLQQKLPPDPDRMKKIYEFRDQSASFRRMKLDPLERGWSGTKMPGRSIGPPDSIEGETFEGFDTKVLESRIIMKMDSSQGRRRFFNVFSVTGNKNGLAGFAVGKSTLTMDASRKSKNKAGQTLMYIERCDNHTVFHNFHTKFMSTSIIVKRMPEGYGLRCHRAIREICHVVGIKNLYAKVHGSMNIQSITKAFFLGLLQQRTYQQLADEKKVYVVKSSLNSFPEIVATPSDGKVRTQAEIDRNEEMDLNVHAMDGKIEIPIKKLVPFYRKLPSYEKHLQKYQRKRIQFKLHRQLYLEHGELRSFLTDKHPEARPGFKIEEEEDDY